MGFGRWGLRIGVVAALCGAFPAARAETPASDIRPEWCPAVRPEDVSTSDQFRKLAAKINRGETIKLVAIGSSSTEGSDLADKRLAYPTHLEHRLNTLLGAKAVKVVNKGRGGENILEAVARFQRDVMAEEPDLVIWQLGTNDIVRNIDADLLKTSVDMGLSLLAQGQVPVVMMDSQIAPRVMLSAQRGPIDRMIREAASRHGAMVWSRFELMRSIIARGTVDQPDLIKADDLHMTVPMHVCTGSVLGETIAASLRGRQVTAGR